MRIGRHNTRVTLWRIPQHTDDDDGFYEPLTPLVWWCSVQPLPPAELGRVTLSIVTMRSHPQVTVDTRVVISNGGIDDEPPVHGERQLIVKGVQRVDDGGVELRLYCEEVT